MQRMHGTATVLLLALVGGVTGEPEPFTGVQPSQPTVDPGEITGDDFAGLRLPVEPISGQLAFEGSRAWLWEVEGSLRADGSRALPVKRLFLSGDVKLQIGGSAFEAAQAVIWFTPLDENTFQVFAYLDRVGTSAADASLAVTADRLRVQAIVRTEAGVTLKANRRFEGPASDVLVRDGQRELAAYLRGLVRGEQARAPALPTAVEDAERIAELTATLPPVGGAGPIIAKDGVITFSGGDVAVVAGAEENSVIISNGVVVQYWDKAGTTGGRPGRTLELTAQRAVLFLDPGPLADLAKVSAANVRGMYLEGNVVGGDGQFTVRSPRVYYDIRNDRAVMVDAVLWTYDQRRRIPLYVRAKTVRQESEAQFRADRAVLTTTAFADPLLALGASSVKLELRETESGERRPLMDARHLTLQAGGVPFFWWPIYRGDPTRFPLRRLRLENSSDSGGALRTGWDAYSLLGIEPTEGVDAELLVDAYFDRGLALGGRLDWDRARAAGGVFLYGVLNDTGTDLYVTGAERERDGEFRGIVTGEHRAELDDHWSLFLEGSYISDEGFVDAYFEDLGRRHREFKTGATLERSEGNALFLAQVEGNLNDFSPNEYLLQTPGYGVDRLPEFAYYRQHDDLVPVPGLLTWSSDSRIGYLRLAFYDPPVEDFGFDTITRSQTAFGIAPGESLADAARVQGLTEDGVARFDTRHEIDANLHAGPVSITPFVVGRLTAYDQSFESYSPDATDEERLWGAAGVRVSTALHRVDDSVESRLLDLHRIRHIVEPNVSVWTAGTSVDRADLPVYDAEVESIAEGTAIKVGVDQTWQTQRGGPGRWHSVDVFRLSTDYVYSTNDTDRETPIGRYFDFRPELSALGEYFTLDAVWRVTEATALSSNLIYDFDTSQPARTTAGAIIQHNPDFATFAEVRFINPLDSTDLVFGANYRLGRRYTVTGAAVYNADKATFQRMALDVRRRFSVAVLGAELAYNDITGETSFGFVLQPLGLDQGFGSRIQDGVGGPMGR